MITDRCCHCDHAHSRPDQSVQSTGRKWRSFWESFQRDRFCSVSHFIQSQFNKRVYQYKSVSVKRNTRITFRCLWSKFKWIKRDFWSSIKTLITFELNWLQFYLSWRKVTKRHLKQAFIIITDYILNRNNVTVIKTYLCLNTVSVGCSWLSVHQMATGFGLSSTAGLISAALGPGYPHGAFTDSP